MTPAKKPAAAPAAKKATATKKVAPQAVKKASKAHAVPAKKTPTAKAAPAKKTPTAKAAPAKKAASKAPAKPAPVKATKAPAPKKAVAPKAQVPKAHAPKAAPVAKAVPEKKAAAPAKAAPAKAKVNPYLKEPKFLDEMRKELEDKKAEELVRAADLRADAESLTSNREPGDDTFNEESGEGSTFAVDRADLLFNAEKAMEKVDEIDEALYRMQRGTYGVCETCHEPIPKLRLRAMPEAKECVACKNGGLTRR